MTLSQLESIRIARQQLLDSPNPNDHKTASLLDWAVTAEPVQTLFLALHKGGEGYVSDERRDVDHAAGVLTTSHPTTTADEFHEAYQGEDVTVFEIARPTKAMT